MRKVSVLLFVRPAALLQMVEQILRRQPQLSVVGRLTQEAQLASHARRLRPELVVTTAPLPGATLAERLRRVRRASPRAKVLLLGFLEGFAFLASNYGADAYLEAETLEGELLPTIRRLLHSEPRPARKRPARPSRKFPQALLPKQSRALAHSDLSPIGDCNA